MLRTVLTIIFITILTGCATVKPEVYGQMPPGKYWVEIPTNDPSITAWGSKGTHKDETYAVIIRELPLAPSESIEVFTENVKTTHKDIMGSHDFVMTDELRLMPDSENWCMEYESVSICKDAKRYSHRTDPMMLHEIGRYCRHPKNNDILLLIYYSRRFYRGDEAPGFSREAQNFLDGVAF